MTEERPLEIGHLQPLYADEPEALVKLVAEAVDTSVELIDKFERQCAARDSEAASTGHELKGLSQTIGAQELARLSEDLEVLAKQGRWPELARRIPTLRDAHRSLAAAAAELRGSSLHN